MHSSDLDGRRCITPQVVDDRRAVSGRGGRSRVRRVCTVLLRIDPAGAWPLLLLAVRDEYLGRAWDAPGRHWPDRDRLVGGRDRVSGGTWLAVDPQEPAVAAV